MKRNNIFKVLAFDAVSGECFFLSFSQHTAEGLCLLLGDLVEVPPSIPFQV